MDADVGAFTDCASWQQEARVRPIVRAAERPGFSGDMGMKRERGQITMYAALALGVLFLGLSIALKVQSSRLESCKTEAAAFQASVKAQGDAAALAAKAEIERQDRLLKQAEAKGEKAKSDLAVANKRLRDERAGRGAVPAAPDGSKRPDLACFDRPLLESALRRLDAGVSGIVDAGDESTLRLKLSRDWALDALRK